jgi:ribosomal protein S6--L-glutamate ligase
LHRGGAGVRLELPKSYIQTAITAVKVMGLEVAGVDMLEGKNGPKVLEINSSPGLEGIEKTSGIDVAGKIIEHAERFVKALTAARSQGKRVGYEEDPALTAERRPKRLPKSKSDHPGPHKTTRNAASPKASKSANKSANKTGKK